MSFISKKRAKKSLVQKKTIQEMPPRKKNRYSGHSMFARSRKSRFVIN